MVLESSRDRCDPRPAAAVGRDGARIKRADRSGGVRLRILVDPGDQRSFGHRETARAERVAVDDNRDLTRFCLLRA